MERKRAKKKINRRKREERKWKKKQWWKRKSNKKGWKKNILNLLNDDKVKKRKPKLKKDCINWNREYKTEKKAKREFFTKWRKNFLKEYQIKIQKTADARNRKTERKNKKNNSDTISPRKESIMNRIAIVRIRNGARTV